MNAESMRRMILLVSGFACAGYGSRVHRPSEQGQSKLHAKLQNLQGVYNPLQDFAILLVAFNPMSIPHLSELRSHAHQRKQTAESQRALVHPIWPNRLTPHMSEDDVVEGEARALTPEEKEEVTNLVADDEWLGLGIELAIGLRSAIRESMQKVPEFTGKDDYKIGDISKELDARVKQKIADLRGKDEYELGDLSVAMNQIAKDELCKLTGKDDYEFGDLSNAVDSQVKAAINDFTGNDEYAPGDLSVAISKRIEGRVNDFTGQSEYKFGDISREIEKQRVAWIQDYLGKQDYEFGDLTQKWVSEFTGKDTYEFGDVTKKMVSSFTGKEKYEFGDITKTLGKKLFGNKE